MLGVTQIFFLEAHESRFVGNVTVSTQKLESHLLSNVYTILFNLPLSSRKPKRERETKREKRKWVGNERHYI
jgi:hypothetical protein